MARVSFDDVKRAGSALAWLLLFAAVGILVTLLLTRLVPWGGPQWQFHRDVVHGLIGFLVATIVVGRVLAKESWDRLGWHAPVVSRLVNGAAMGLLMAALAIGLAFVLDRTSVALTYDWSRWPRVALWLAIMFLCASLAEELMFRGFPLRRLSDAIGPLPAMLLLAIGFAVAHLGNPAISFVGVLNIALAGIWLSLAFFSAGGMALAWGLHFGWNAGLALAFDAPVSGYMFRVPAVEYTPGAHPWVDGGTFGPEGGIVGTIIIIAGIFAVIGRRVKQPRTWLAG
ncbi:MAG TPA: CPBP family intramembrane glutamic endopeptidase [Gemmatimonadales bacterium]|nr:CPBP family intramembrane glutamic endopeptidase [Gemmatimonadales bacterium]